VDNLDARAAMYLESTANVGPSKLPQMARDLGRFVGEARRSIDEFKDELSAASDEEENKRKKR